MSGVRRFFIDKASEHNEIDGDEYAHAINTLRLGIGDRIILFDNSGYDFLCRITNVGKKSFEADLVEKRSNPNESKNRVSLVCGYLKGDKTEYVVQKAVELGVSDIAVFSSQYSSAFMSDKKLERLNKVSLEAAKQCGRAIYPKVVYCRDFSCATEYGKHCKNRLFFYENKTNYVTHINKIEDSCVIVVGSEGGFSEQEVKLAVDSGYNIISLGKRILRADTASICAISIVMHELGELQ